MITREQNFNRIETWQVPIFCSQRGTRGSTRRLRLRLWVRGRVYRQALKSLTTDDEFRYLILAGPKTYWISLLVNKEFCKAPASPPGEWPGDQPSSPQSISTTTTSAAATTAGRRQWRHSVEMTQWSSYAFPGFPSISPHLFINLCSTYCTWVNVVAFNQWGPPIWFDVV